MSIMNGSTKKVWGWISSVLGILTLFGIVFGLGAQYNKLQSHVNDDTGIHQTTGEKTTLVDRRITERLDREVAPALYRIELQLTEIKAEIRELRKEKK